MDADQEKQLMTARVMKIIRDCNANYEAIHSFRKEYPNVISPNILIYIEENIKENITLLYKEVNNLNKPKEEKIQYICRNCKCSFFSRLPYGLCDKCRSELNVEQNETTS